MKSTIEFLKPFLKTNLPLLRPGDKVRVFEKIKEKSQKGKKEVEEKERIQVFEGIILAKKHGKGISSTITVRKIVDGIGVERIFPLHSPIIEKIEILNRSKVRRAKLYYLRKAKGKKAKLKKKGLTESITNEKIEKEEMPKEIELSKAPEIGPNKTT